MKHCAFNYKEGRETHRFWPPCALGSHHRHNKYSNFFFFKGKNTGLEQLRVILGSPHSLSQGVPRDRSHLPFPLPPPNPHICPGREVKESFFPGVTNSYLTLKTPKSVLLPFSGHSASTLWVSHSVSDQGAKGIS